MDHVAIVAGLLFMIFAMPALSTKYTDEFEECDLSCDLYDYDYPECGKGVVCYKNETYTKCISPDWICDSLIDCPDGRDERKDLCENDWAATCRQYDLMDKFHRRRSSKFVCDSGMCIDKDITCDGYDDCGDGTDELRTSCGQPRGDW